MKLNEKGIIFGLVIASAFVFSVAAFMVLTMTHARFQRVGFETQRLKAHYAAEAGLVWAMQQLWVTPTWSSGAGTDLTIETYPVDVTIAACSQTPCEDRTLKAKVSF